MAGGNLRAETTTSTSETTTSSDCSICLDKLGDTGRPMTKLRCGHQFHLDCIGSAFNSKHGVMQCPYCRNIEKEGQWLLSPSSSRDSYVIDQMEFSWPPVPYPTHTYNNLNYGEPSTLVDEGGAQVYVHGQHQYYPHHRDASHLIYPGYAYAGASRLLFAHVYPDAHQLVPVYVDAGSHYNIEVDIEGEINGSDYNIEVVIEEEYSDVIEEEEEEEEEEVSSRYCLDH